VCSSDLIDQWTLTVIHDGWQSFVQLGGYQ